MFLGITPKTQGEYIDNLLKYNYLRFKTHGKLIYCFTYFVI